MHSEPQHFSPLRACSWNSEYFTEDSIHSSSHTEENTAPSFKRREGHHLLYQVPRATPQKASNSFEALMLPSRSKVTNAAQ